ncbi:MAG TPA: neutral zinc metallopeptidase [Bryobacteraceae bacterium]|jgi:predicted metalloprotease|nr:neutral zinc metallopeptidase [Bryobacteraceae bacterium]
MQWTPGEDNPDIEDRRDESGGGGGGGPIRPVHLGLGGVLIVGALSLIFHQNFFALLSGPPGGSISQPSAHSLPNAALDEQEKPKVQFVGFVLGDVQRVWEQKLGQYRHAKLVLFRDSYPSACGQAETATGPFYCPGDEKVYLDLGFFDELRDRFGAPGEFAEAYVIAHEIGHHVQKILGIESKVRQLQMRSPSEQNPLSVKLELQADCFAGAWANSTEQRKIIDQSDVESGLQAAAAVGDDRLQRAATGRVNPESFTHGSSAQRVSWFQRGMKAGDISACNTFNAQ